MPVLFFFFFFWLFASLEKDVDIHTNEKAPTGVKKHFVAQRKAEIVSLEEENHSCLLCHLVAHRMPFD